MCWASSAISSLKKKEKNKNKGNFTKSEACSVQLCDYSYYMPTMYRAKAIINKQCT